ncbi:hypothetical protein D3C75_265360 [compost metagenome]
MKSPMVFLLASALTAGILFNIHSGTANIMLKPSISSSRVLLYTSMNKEKGKYTEKVKALLNQVLDGLHASH